MTPHSGQGSAYTATLAMLRELLIIVAALALGGGVGALIGWLHLHRWIL